MPELTNTSIFCLPFNQNDLRKLASLTQKGVEEEMGGEGR
jgi:hypothetical protein